MIADVPYSSPFSPHIHIRTDSQQHTLLKQHKQMRIGNTKHKIYLYITFHPQQLQSHQTKEQNPKTTQSQRDPLNSHISLMKQEKLSHRTILKIQIHFFLHVNLTIFPQPSKNHILHRAHITIPNIIS